MPPLVLRREKYPLRGSEGSYYRNTRIPQSFGELYAPYPRFIWPPEVIPNILLILLPQNSDYSESIGVYSLLKPRVILILQECLPSWPLGGIPPCLRSGHRTYFIEFAGWLTPLLNFLWYFSGLLWLFALTLVLRFLFWAKPYLKRRHVSTFYARTRATLLSRDPSGDCTVVSYAAVTSYYPP